MLVIGYGNTLRRDDGAGVRLAEALVEDPLCSGIRVETGHQLTPEMAVLIAEADVQGVIFFDADVQAVEVSLARLDDAVPSPSAGHHLTPATVMLYADRLYGHRPAAWTVSLPAFDLGHGDQLTEQAEAWVRAGIERVRSMVSYLDTSKDFGKAVDDGAGIGSNT